MSTLGGAARLGWLSVSLASLEVTPAMLRLSVPWIGSYEFQPNEVISIEEYGLFPLGGVQIRHVVPRYPKTIVFSTFGLASSMTESIRLSGFIAAAPSDANYPHHESAFRPIILLGVLALPGMLLLFDSHETFPSLPTFGAAMMFAAGGWAIRLIPRLRRALLKPGRNYEEVRHWVNCACLAGTFLLVALSLVRLTDQG